MSSLPLKWQGRRHPLIRTSGHYEPPPTTQERYGTPPAPGPSTEARVSEPPKRPMLKGPKPPPIAIPSVAKFLPPTGSSGPSYSAQPTAVPTPDENREKKSPGSHRRTRSMSIPPVSTSPVNVSLPSAIINSTHRCRNFTDIVGGGVVVSRRIPRNALIISGATQPRCSLEA